MHDFSPDCVLMVLADAPYDEADYVRSYEKFLASVRR
jgi:dTDP-4-dehydrorhamnose 3,5-epimerase